MENKKFEIGQKTLQTDTQIVVISFFRFKGIFQKIWAFSQMGFARNKLKNIKEISFFKLFGSGTGEGFTPYPNTSVYAYSKAGIASITRVITIELNAYALETDTAPIRVNAVLPGVIRTPMHGRFLDDNDLDGIPPEQSTSPEELAKSIVTRLNEKFLMGSVSIIDGGYTAQ